MNKIRMITYNIHSGTDLYRRPTLEQIGDLLKESEADIISLQEVHQNEQKGMQADQLADKLGMNYRFGANHPVGDGFFGNAILTRFPVQAFSNVLLPGLREQRGLLVVKLAVPPVPVYVMSTHLGLKQQERNRQFQRIQEIVSENNPLIHPTLLTGDFNTSRPPVIHPLYDTGKAANQDHVPTFYPLRRRIDFILAGPHFHLLRYRVIKTKYSDHYPILADLYKHVHPAAPKD
ncbi:MAG: endonuclease/exonuclease/phosphatase family protein [Bacillaceae bacterium]|nr:endonuclease/exonuclease/phosphatase family protein [Bacillaceae bacterium]